MTWILKIAGWLTAALVAAGVATAVLLQADAPRRLLEQRIVSMLTDSTGGITFSKLGGDLFTHAHVDSLYWIKNNDTLLFIPRVSAFYQPVTLLKGPFIIDSVRVDEPRWQIPYDVLFPENTKEESGMEKKDGGFPVQVRKLTVSAGRGILVKESWFPDGPLSVQDVAFQGAFSMDASGWRVTVKSLTGQVQEPRITQKIGVQTGGAITSRQVNFDALMAKAGKTAVNAVFSMDLETLNGTLEAVATPLQPALWKELTTLDIPQQHNARLTLDFQPNRFSVSAVSSSDEADSVRFFMEAALNDTLTIEKMKLEGWNIRPGTWLAETGVRAVRRIAVTFDGKLKLDAPEHTDGKVSLSCNRLATTAFPVLEIVEAKGAIRNGAVEVSSTLKTAGQRLTLRAEGKPFLKSKPEWRTNLRFENINPAFWTGDTSLVGSISGVLNLSGSGATLDELRTEGTLTLSEARMGEYQLDQMNARFKVRDRMLQVSGATRAEGAGLNVESAITLDLPIHADVQIGLKDADIQRFLPEFPVKTAINGRLWFIGSGSDMATLAFAAAIQIDSSRISDLFVKQLSSRFIVEDSTVHIYESKLESDVASGQLEGRLHLFRLFDLRNQLQFSLDFRDLNPLKELLKMEVLQGSGSITAQLRQPRAGELAFNGRLHATRLMLNNLVVSNVHAETNGIYKDSLAMMASLTASSLDVKDVDIREINVDLTTYWAGGPVRGKMALTTVPNPGSKIRTSGAYSYADGITQLQFQTFLAERGDFRLENKRPFTLLASDTLISLSGFELTDRKQASLSVTGTFNPGGSGRVQFSTLNLPLLPISAMLQPDFPVSGTLTASATATLERARYAYEVDAKLRKFRYNGVVLDSSRFSASGNELRVRMQAQAQRGGITLFSAAGTVPLPGAPSSTPIDFSAKLHLPSFAPVRELLASFETGPLDGALSGSLNLSGTAALPRLNASIGLKNASLGTVTLDSVRLLATHRAPDARLLLSSSVWFGGQQLSSLEGFVPFSADPSTGKVRVPSATDSVFIAVRSAGFKLGALAPFVTPFGVKDLTGILNTSIEISGTIASPEVNGKIKLTDGALGLLPFGTTYKNGEARIDFTGNSINIEQFRVLGGRGEASITGTVNLRGVMPDSLNIRFQADQFELARTKNLKLQAASDIRLRGTFHKPVASGQITIQDMTYHMPGLGRKSLEDVSQKEETLEVSIPFYDNCAADIRIILPETFSKLGQRIVIRNKSNPELEIRLTGEVNVVKKEGREAEMFGAISTTSGFARQFGKKFDVNRGILTFSGPLADPALDIETVYHVSRENINIYFRLGGTLRRPEFSYESDPSMDTQDIISYTMFGRPFGALMGWEKNVAGTSTKVATGEMLADATAAFLVEKAGELAGEKLGIDVFEIDNTNRTTGGGTTIKAGKYISDKTMLAVIQQLGANATTQFTLEYQFRRNLQLILTQSDDSRTGIDILWRKDY